MLDESKKDPTSVIILKNMTPSWNVGKCEITKLEAMVSLTITGSQMQLTLHSDEKRESRLASRLARQCMSCVVLSASSPRLSILNRWLSQWKMFL